MCPVDIHAVNMLVIYSIMFGVTCCKICALILLAHGAFFFLKLLILAVTFSAVTGVIGGFSQLSLLKSIISSS